MGVPGVHGGADSRGGEKGQAVTKYYCDWCGVEVRGLKIGERLRGTRTEGNKSMMVEVMTGTGSSINSGVFCQRCIVETINALFKRGKDKP